LVGSEVDPAEPPVAVLPPAPPELAPAALAPAELAPAVLVSPALLVAPAELAPAELAPALLAPATELVAPATLAPDVPAVLVVPGLSVDEQDETVATKRTEHASRYFMLVIV
jgi:hypothetical protein